MDGWQGEPVDQIAMGIYDLLGACYRQGGEREAALAATYSAYERAAALEDRERIVVYGLRMAELYRAAGDLQRAPEWANASAGVLNTSWFRDSTNTLV